VNAIEQVVGLRETPGETARRRFMACEGRPLLLADWERTLFMHFEVPAEVLRPHVPFELDVHEGRAYVSLVAFTMCGMRLARGGRLSRWLCAPLGEQRFLNVRTYVRHQGEAGIHFIAEWISNAFCVPFGPVTYGLPYRWGGLHYEHAHESGTVRGRVKARRGGGVLEYSARLPGGRFDSLEAGSRDEFLIERYAAFTRHGERRRLFRIWHEPWQVVRAEADFGEDSLLRGLFPWWQEARFAGANYSPGCFNIWMGRPRKARPV